ncbi:MAG: DUF1810 domain-containing protein [Chitinophagaceae bacterium]|nr:MAG: DUF1810 domain-containing protein [Chitinophagaceae bacterium]
MAQPYNLERFINAQDHQYPQALAEVQRGRKTSHWMWYIFPQVKGLGASDMAHHYGIRNIDEAAAYLHHPVLGKRLVEISSALLSLQAMNIEAVLGHTDSLKLRSCMTLFSLVEGADDVFERVLLHYFNGRKDDKTIGLLGM